MLRSESVKAKPVFCFGNHIGPCHQLRPVHMVRPRGWCGGDRMASAGLHPDARAMTASTASVKEVWESAE